MQMAKRSAHGIERRKAVLHVMCCRRIREPPGPRILGLQEWPTSYRWGSPVTLVTAL